MFPIQFTGASFTWERKKLGNVAENLSYGLNLPSTNYDGNNIYLRITDIDDESHTLNRDNLTSPNLGKFDKNILDYKLTENDVVFARTGASVGKTYVYTPTDGNIYFAGFLVRAKFKSSILANFVFYTTLTSKYLNYVKVTSQRSGQPGVNAKEYGNFAISITDSTEQFRIISLLKKLDGTINLHERKCEELTLIKKSLLQKLFPKEDKIKPEIRYKNFSDAWEQRKLGEVIVSEHKGKVKSSMKGGNTNYLETNYLNGGTAQKVDAIADVSKDDVLILWDGSKAGTIYHGFEGALGSTLKAYVPKYSGDFLYQILKKNQDKIYQSYRTPNIPHVIKNFTEKFNVSIPTIIEQQEIGDFFKQLDSLITLHQRKLEKLKQLKKFLLQNMFI